MSTEPTILIVEDDARLASLLVEYLGTSGFQVTVEGRGDHAVERIHRENPHLVVVDLMLPGLNGFEICKQARPSYHGGLIVLTASKTEIDQTVALELGADDYVVKPVEPRILLARIRSLMRRLGNGASQLAVPDEASVGRLTINRGRREVLVDTRPVELTSLEFDVLWLLVRSAGEVVTREELYPQVRGIRYDGIDRSIDVHVSRLRQKLEAAGLNTGAIKTVRGMGYVLVKR